MASSASNPESRPRCSETHATDSTWSGCTPNTAAPAAAAQALPHRRARIRHTTSVAATCRPRLARWKSHGGGGAVGAAAASHRAATASAANSV